MTVIELRNKLNDLMNKYPNTINDTIYIHTWVWSDELIDEVQNVLIEYDLNSIGRYITIS